MIGKILSGIFGLIIKLVNVIMLPIDLLLNSVFPDISNALVFASNIFNSIGNVIGWVIDASGISSEIISLVVSYWVFQWTVGLGIYLVKLALSWYDKLKP